ncbi:MAG: group 1 truncated hemoglobin [Hyphomonas sp.]|nr:group 1 truncated hemoglobin [Hyphomonas sp.]
MAKTIYEKYGGFSTISKIVMDLYDRLLDDEIVGPFFDNVDMSRIIDHQTKFVSSLVGGPASYTDEQIRRMHDHLKIGTEHFETLKALLSSTLSDHGLEEEDVQAVVGEFEKRRKLVTD